MMYRALSLSVVQRLAQSRYLGAKIPSSTTVLGQDSRHELVLHQELARAFDKRNQDLEGATPRRTSSVPRSRSWRSR